MYMPTFIHADIFFFVATVSMIILTLLLIIICINIIKIAVNIRGVSDKARLECELIILEIGTIRERLRNHNLGVGTLVRIFRKYIY